MRDNFLLDHLFKKGKIDMVYVHVDRAIVGSAVPTMKKLELKASKKELAAGYFAERREIGVINIGKNSGIVKVDDKQYQMKKLDGLYIGRGHQSIQFRSKSPEDPAYFYFVSYPAHKEYPTTLVKQEDAASVNLGSTKGANQRTIYKYIHPEGIKSCQLVMGFTVLEEGSVWNTMAAHTHERRSEIYMYFSLPKNGIVCHIMGEPQETRHLMVRNREAVISPSWSIHSGAGTSNYSFVWSMGGENQAFDDMDGVDMERIR
jgi:4-deoxy-L-threo-5-hexosulose-uronate ketol-isomerase